MSTSTAPVPSEKQYYAFGQKSAAVIGLLMTSEGQFTGLAYRRPRGYAPMEKLYTTDPVQLAPGTTLSFTMTLAADKDGLLSFEPRGWNYPYESHRAHFLGTFNPFGADEIPFQDFGGINRRKDIPANRVFSGVFKYDPVAADHKQRATIKLVDVESRGQGEEVVSISAFYDSDTGIPGGLFVSLRVNWDNYADGCATLEFTDKHMAMLTGDEKLPFSRFVLNTTNNPA